MGQRISGREIDARLSNGQRLLFESISLNTSSGIKAVKDQGYPAGWVYGEISGSGEIEISTEDMLVLNEQADLAGSWEELQEMDLTFFAKAGSLELNIEVFGVKVDFPGFDFNGKGGDKLTHKIPFEITSEDFVKINGVRLARRKP